MGSLRNLAQKFQEFATNHIEERDVPLIAVGDSGYEKSTKLALLLLKRGYQQTAPAVRRLSERDACISWRVRT
jgi:hypothetical protein